MGAVIDDVIISKTRDGKDYKLRIKEEYIPFFMLWSDRKLKFSVVSFGEDGKSLLDFLEVDVGETFNVDATDLEGCVVSGFFILKELNHECEEREGEMVYKIDVKMQM